MKEKISGKEGGFFLALLASLAASFVQPVIYSAVKGISGRVIRRARREFIDKKNFVSTPSFKQYQD